MGIELTEVSCKRLNNTKSQRRQSTKRSIKHKQVFIYHWKYSNTTKEGLSVDDDENISQMIKSKEFENWLLYHFSIL